MKIFLILIIGFLFCLEQLTSQELTSFKSEQNKRMGEQLQGGVDEYHELLSNNITYPLKYKRTGIQGVGAIQFMIDKKGKAYNQVIMPGVAELFGKELIRLTKIFPWKPDGRGQVFEWSVIFNFRSSDDMSFASLQKASFKKFSKFYQKGKLKKALRHLNDALVLNPYQTSMLRTRTLLYIQLDELVKACQDNARLQQLGGDPVEGLTCAAN